MSTGSPPVLPLYPGDGLTLRLATRADARALADFNARIHAAGPPPDESMRAWTLDLIRGNHPTAGPGDFTVVVDRAGGGKIVSSLGSIPQTWTYAGVPFLMGRPELVGTDAGYRRRGLVAAQFEVIHALGAARGELLQGITGIPWYYRQFGYEMALALDCSRRLPWSRIPERKAGQGESFRLRAATPDDIPHLQEMYQPHIAGQLVARPRDAALWRYEMCGPRKKSQAAHDFRIVETLDGQPVAYTDVRPLEWDKLLEVRELCAAPGRSLYEVATFLCWRLQAEAEKLNRKREMPLRGLRFSLGPAHPVYRALDDRLEPLRHYAWYLRLPDLPAFLRHIAPALQERLRGSPVEGYTGALRLNFYQSQHRLEFSGGALVAVGDYQPESYFDGDAFFPGLTFLQLLFGFRSLADLKHAYPDCFTRDGLATLLLDTLFPRSPSEPVPLA